MADLLRDVLLRQHDLAWKLAAYHLDGLDTDACLWRPAARGLHVWPDAEGAWRADWPQHEGYGIGPPSIAWTTWHIGFWWSTVLDRTFGAGRLARDAVLWPGDAEGVRAWIGDLRAQWRARLENLSEADLSTPDLSRWPFVDRPFADIVAWANVELMKNAAEIGYGRFLYAAREGA
jgi:hypothetical protein